VGPPLDRQGYLGGLAALLLVAASIHYANEYADHETDALTDRTPFSGGGGALVELPVPRRLARDAAAVTLVAGVGLAVACLLHGQTVLGIGVLLLGAVRGWQYSFPPLRLAWNGVGEVDNALLGRRSRCTGTPSRPGASPFRQSSRSSRSPCWCS
jgi:1,4-dihydroxy-2-naphthoate octaprenyltransferase